MSDKKLPQVIGLIGQKSSGKSRTADYLISHHDYVEVSFGKAVKEVVMKGFGLSEMQVYDEKEKEIIDDFWGVTPRQMLQFVGTECFREQMPKLLKDIGKNFWIKRLNKQVLELLEQGKNVVISDVRFQNECDYVKSFPSSLTIKLLRKSSSSSSFDSHASETECLAIKTDKIIENYYDLFTLYSNVEKCIK